MAYYHGAYIDFSRPGKATNNASIEAFNESLRDERLNVHWFETITEGRRLIEDWRIDYKREPSSHGSWKYPVARICFASKNFYGRGRLDQLKMNCKAQNELIYVEKRKRRFEGL